MRVALALALLSLSFAPSAHSQESREDLFAARDAAWVERSASQAQLDAVATRIDGFATETARYQAALEQAQAYCTETFTDRAAYDARMAECRVRRAELDAWRAQLEAGPDALIAAAVPMQGRIDAANARVAQVDRKLRALGPSTEFERTMIEADRQRRQQLRGLQAEIERIVVPSSASRRVIHEGVILGMMSGPEDVALLQAETSPFVSGRSTQCENRVCTYGELIRDGRAAAYAFGDHDMLAETLRVILDNQSAARYTLSSERARAIVRELNGERFERLLAHSNGATIAEALIRTGVIKVDEFNVIGGDRSLAGFASMQEMIDSGRVRRVKIWLNPGDPVPTISSTPLSWSIAREAQYWAGVATGQNRGGDARVEYCVIGGPAVGWSAEAHRLQTYMTKMRTGSCRN
jgi:hypothetical protein